MRVEEYVYYVNKRRQNVGLETWLWRQIVTSQRQLTTNKWPPYATERNPPWKFSAYATVIAYLSKWEQNFSKLFLLKWLFLWLQMLSVPLNTGVKPFTKPTLPVGWHWSITLLAVQAYRTIGAFKHTKCTISPQERGFPTLWRHTEKYQFYWN